MPGLLPNVDPDGLLEYSVVYTDRSVNHMSARFQQTMRDISDTLKSVYQGEAVVLVPGGGTFAMEAVARQFATDQKCLVLRNGWFSFRWTQIFETGRIPAESSVLKARPIEEGPQAAFAPAPIEQVVEAIRRERPAVVFAPHVETSSGMILPNDYLEAVGDAVREAGGLFVLDCIASGTLWVEMDTQKIDVVISAPQKGWSGSPCAGVVILNDRAAKRMQETTSTSFACDLRKWSDIMSAYESGGHAYHATLPTDAITRFCEVIKEAKAHGFEKLRTAQQQLGDEVRGLLAERGFKSVAANGFGAPGVVVSYTTDPGLKSGGKFTEHGLQIAAGVPLRCDEPEDFQTFRIGLFGLDKLQNIARTVSTLKGVLDQIAS